MRTVHSAEYELFLLKLRTARERRGLSQKLAADLLNIPQSQLSRMENGERSVNAVELRHFATLYRRPLGYFV
jgi:transcriptional regulator with XRE-family HTH domain